ncbi:MAG: CYTH domain-containing protein [Lachnospiraceae bacterium]|nr:CYTH domain-containing protein [Lachnospira sp.]MBR6697914.1 CYTH domain-containing protein [Lachnospiraceae bacterium]
MEIEKKFLINSLPFSLENLKCHDITQAYLCTNPVVRVRKDNEDYILTYKGKGHMIREEYNLPLNSEAFFHLLKKADGNIITKKRYEIPIENNLTVELDIFEGKFAGLVLAEVEFETEEDALNFIPPSWFAKEVTTDKEYHNSTMSRKVF